MSKFFSLTFLCCFVDTYASSSGKHHPSVRDLLWPAFNFTILFGFLFFKLKGRLSSMFDKNAEAVSAQYSLAEKKSSEANKKIKDFKDKLSNIPAERDKVFAETKTDIANFENKMRDDTAKTIERLKREMVNNVAHEKSVMLNQINALLVDEVINKAKETINSSSDYQKRATSKILSQIN